MEQTLSYMDTEAWGLVYEIEQYVKHYVPTGWKESIGTVMFVPYLAPDDLPLVLQGVFPRNTKHPCLHEALASYLNQGKKDYCKECRYFTYEPEESPDGYVGRCSRFPMYVLNGFGCKLFVQTSGIRCGPFKRINGKLYFGE